MKINLDKPYLSLAYNESKADRKTLVRRVSSNFSLDRIRAEKFRDFFILRESGYSIYHRAYVTSKVDDDLISGFLSAIFAFSKELSIDQIHVMDMQESKFIYETRPPFIFILNAAKDVDPRFGQKILIKIMSFFEKSIEKLGKTDKSNDNSIVKELKSIDFDKKLDYFINNALLEDYYASPTKILDEIESFLVGLFGSVGKEIVKLAIQKVCKRRESFHKKNIEGLIITIGESLTRKMRGSQVELIIKQLKDAFVTNLK